MRNKESEAQCLESGERGQWPMVNERAERGDKRGENFEHLKAREVRWRNITRQLILNRSIRQLNQRQRNAVCEITWILEVYYIYQIIYQQKQNNELV
jgi:hypothetical protein